MKPWYVLMLITKERKKGETTFSKMKEEGLLFLRTQFSVGLERSGPTVSMGLSALRTRDPHAAARLSVSLQLQMISVEAQCCCKRFSVVDNVIDATFTLAPMEFPWALSLRVVCFCVFLTTWSPPCQTKGGLLRSRDVTSVSCCNSHNGAFTIRWQFCDAKVIVFNFSAWNLWSEGLTVLALKKSTFFLLHFTISVA